MPREHARLTSDAARGAVADALETLRVDLELPGAFPADVERDARRAARDAALPERDLRDVPFVTIDPNGARDLDQAMFLSRLRSGFEVQYAIADVPRVVAPGSPLDRESRERVETIYLPSGRIPLHPPVLSEDAASLLPGRDRAAFVWRMLLDGDGRVRDVSLGRAVVRSRRALTYDDAQRSVDGDPLLGLLREVGEARIAREHERGGASLNVPEVEASTASGHYRLVRRRPLPVEDWNAQISLMTGMQAARIMLDGKVGILRTMPQPSEEAEAEFRRRTQALGHPWPAGVRYGDYLRSVDPDDPRGLAVLHAAASLFRGAGYTAFDGDRPADAIQSAVAAPYAHVTAPLRRLVDRFGLVVCEALVGGRAVPDWARSALPGLPAVMASSKAGTASRRSIDIIEAASVAHRVGDEFDAEVIAGDDAGGRIQVVEPPVTASCSGPLTPGTRIRARLVRATIETGQLAFEPSSSSSSSSSRGLRYGSDSPA